LPKIKIKKFLQYYNQQGAYTKKEKRKCMNRSHNTRQITNKHRKQSEARVHKCQIVWIVKMQTKHT